MTELQACSRHNVTLQGCYALSYSLLSAAELRDGMVVTKQYSTVYSALQNITNHIISEGYPTDAILVERFVPLSNQFKIILMSISKKAFKFE